jgi:hypothetical protein
VSPLTGTLFCRIPLKDCKLNNLKFLWGGHLARPVKPVESLTGYLIHDPKGASQWICMINLSRTDKTSDFGVSSVERLSAQTFGEARSSRRNAACARKSIGLHQWDTPSVNELDSFAFGWLS